jgi:hypothetical protein
MSVKQCGSYKMAMGDIIGNCEVCNDLQAENERLTALIRPFEGALKKVEEQGQEIEQLKGQISQLQALFDRFGIPLPDIKK